MTPDDTQRAENDVAHPRPAFAHAIAVSQPQVVEQEIGYPRPRGYPADHRRECEAIVVRRETTDERSRLFGDDAGEEQRDVGPESFRTGQLRRERRRGL